jgi:hypothetical protein
VKCFLQRSCYPLVSCASLPLYTQPWNSPRVDARPCSVGMAVVRLVLHIRTAVRAKTVPQTAPSRGIIQRELPFQNGCSCRGDSANREGVAQCFSTGGPQIVPTGSASCVDSVLLFLCHTAVSFKGFSSYFLLPHWIKNITKKLHLLSIF